MMKLFTLFALLVSNVLYASIPSGGTTVYYSPTTIPLSFSRNAGSGPVTGLTVTVSVVNAATNATLLASTSAGESATGSGVYTFLWTPTVTVDTACLVTYTVGTSKYTEFIFISGDTSGGRAS